MAITTLSICPCWDLLFKSDDKMSSTYSERNRTTSRTRSSRTGKYGSKSGRSRKKNDYFRFFKEPKMTLNDLKFSHRLSTITNDRLINFIKLPFSVSPGDDGNVSNDQVEKIIIKTPDQFFHWMGYQRLKLLGKGGFGTVYLVEKFIPVIDEGKEKIVSQRMACKEMRLREQDCSLINSLRAELYVLQSLSNKCRYVVNYYEHYMVEHFSVVEQSKIWIACIFIEFVNGGCLLDEVEKKGPLPVDLARRYFFEMVKGLEFMHRNQISHNDFKLDNVLLMWDEEHRHKYCKLTDFGMARLAYKDGVGVVYSQRYCGTRRYMAPEVIRCGQNHHNNNHNPQYIPFSADIWSLGVSLYVLLKREFPYETPRDCVKLYRAMQRGVLNTRELRKKFGRKLTQLLSGMLEFDPDVRYSISKVASHKWLKGKF